jgi:Fe-S cluster assembly iron-binding protein IscA
LAQTNFQLPTVQGIFTVSANTTGAKNVSFSETSVMGTPAGITVTGGNNQTQAVKTTLRNALTVLVTDQYDNPVSGVAVTFSDNAEGGSFSNKNPVYTDSTGTTWQAYTLPPVGGTFKVTATTVGVATPAIFTEVAQ